MSFLHKASFRAASAGRPAPEWLLGIVLLGLGSAVAPEVLAAEPPGLVPENRDGFESGDWRNFRPRYVGTSTEWIRPRFVVSDQRPISGNYSLEWRGGSQEHQWLMLSNAFHLKRPMSVSVDFRGSGSGGDWAAGLFLMESYERFSGIQVRSSEARLHLDSSGWDEGTESGVSLEAGPVYRLFLEFGEDFMLAGSVVDLRTGETLARLEGKSALEPGALAIYVHTLEGSETTLAFDDVIVESAPYRVTSGEWTRSPHFVALPRLPDVPQEEGNWVGAQSVMKTEDGRYLMWYRIRNNQVRGAGYGFAHSQDGVRWTKYENNPIFKADPQYTSNEKISVLKVDGLYRTWYTVDTGRGWITVYATSTDGIAWEQHGPVIDETYCKDADVVYVDGTYYLYAIGPTNTDIAVFTSSDGIEWEHRNTFEMGVHRHVAAYYIRSTGRFVLYPTAGGQGVGYAVSADGIHFGPFRQTWTPPAVGLDDWEEAGITYLSFLRNEHGHINDEAYLPVYYQARNTYANNIPGWLYHGGERVVLAGCFHGLYLGVPTRIRPDAVYEYEAFPFEVERARGLETFAAAPVRLRLDRWRPREDPIALGTVEGPARTQLQWKAERLTPEALFEVLLDGEVAAAGRADKAGRLLLRTLLPGEGALNFEIRRAR